MNALTNCFTSFMARKYPVFYLGITPDMDKDIRRPIIIVNALAFLTSTMALLVAGILTLMTKESIIFVIALCESATCSIILLLNKRHRYNSANTLTYCNHAVYAVIFGAVLGEAMPIDLIVIFILIFLIGSSVLVYRNNETRIVSFIMCYVSFFLIKFNAAQKFISPIPITPELLLPMQVACWIGMAILISLITYFVIAENDDFLAGKKALLKKLGILNEDLAKANADLVKASTGKTEFIRQTSHEIRTPLNAILSIAQLLALKLDYPDSTIEDSRPEIESLLQATITSKEIVSNILDISKLEAGKLHEVAPETVHLKSHISSTIQTLRYIADAKETIITIDFPAEIEDLIIVTDKKILRQICYNLLSNAIKFSPPNSTVNVVVAYNENNLTVWIRNYGTISKNSVIKLFQPFETSNSDQGTGLGLNITKKLVGLLNGKIEYEIDDFTTTFNFLIPAPIAEKPSIQNSISFKGQFKGYKILIIEDDPLQLKLANQFISITGAAPILCKTGKEGFEKSIQELPAIIICDRHLPDMSAFEIIQKIRTTPGTKEIPIIIASADAFTEAKTEMINAGANHYITKPYLFAVMAKAISENIKKY